MKPYNVLREQLERAVAEQVRRALKRHKTVRAAAASLAMPKSTLHDIAQRLGIDTSRRAAS